MTVLEFFLIAATLLGLIATWWSEPRGLYGLPFVAAALSVVQLFVGGYNANLLSVYLLVTVLCLVAGRQLLRRRPVASQPRHGIQVLLAVFGRLLGLFALFLAVRGTLFTSQPPLDLRGRSWIAAFDAMHARISHQYAFGAWKGVDWDWLYATYAPQVAAAEAQQDKAAYYLALLGYTSTVPDGHVWLKGNDFGTRQSAVGGGYGLQILALDDGRIIAVGVAPGGPAQRAGMQWGAEILSWGGLPVEMALERTPVLWSLRRGAPATLEGLRLARCRLLVRGPVGAQTAVTFLNPGDSQASRAILTAVDDGEMSLDGNADPRLPPVEPGVILPGGYGYIKINHEHEAVGADEPVKVFRDAVQLFVGKQVRGVILDARGNLGGSDELVPQFVGHFFTDRLLYEKVTLFFSPLNTFIERPPQLWIEPLEPHYAGPVVVLVDNATFSSGEGIPLAVRALPQGAVIGFYGTYGSFGMTGGVIQLPEELTLYFPNGQSLDAQGIIQLDSDASLLGGVAPTIRVPLTEATARALFVDQEDVLLDFAIRYIDER